MSEKKKKGISLLRVFIAGGVVAEAVIIAIFVSLYYVISYFDFRFDILYFSVTFSTTGVAILIGIVIINKLGKRVLRPVVEINKAAQAVTEGDFSVRLAENGRVTEIREIARSFNTMVKELGNTELFHEDFIANVSHEFKTPLATIEAYATLLQDCEDDNEREEYTRLILRNAQRMSTLTENILMLSRLQKGENLRKKEWFRIDEQICNVMVEYAAMWEAKQMEVDLEVEELEVYGYRELLPHVWSNLIVNAIKYSGTGGSLKLVCRREEERILVQVTDTGIGMSRQVQQHIFDKFYQGDLSHGTEGNGLGLPLVKTIVELSGGSISVESEPGKGSTFRVSLPVE